MSYYKKTTCVVFFYNIVYTKSMQNIKKMLIIAILFIVTLFGINKELFAQTATPIESVKDKVLTVVSGGNNIDIKLTQYEITDKSITIKGKVKSKSDKSSLVSLTFGHNDNLTISLDPGKRDNDKGKITGAIYPFLENGFSDTNWKDMQADIVVTGLEPATTYYLQLVDDSLTKTIYQPITYTTLGEKPINQEPEKPLSTADQKKAIHITPNNPSYEKDQSTGEYTVTFSGIVSVDATIENVGFSLYFGKSEGELRYGDIAYSPRLISKGAKGNYNISLSGFPIGTYYYKFFDTDTGRNYESAMYSFTISEDGINTPTSNHTQPIIQDQPVVYYDPEQETGIFPYDLPTNIGAPAEGGSVTIEDSESTLVPCGKRSDGGGDAQYCRFEHLLILFGNIIDYLLILLVPLVVLTAISTGVQMIIHRKVPGDLEEYMKRLTKIAQGAAVILLAWTLIATLLNVLVDENSRRFILLDIVSTKNN